MKNIEFVSNIHKNETGKIVNFLRYTKIREIQLLILNGYNISYGSVIALGLRSCNQIVFN